MPAYWHFTKPLTIALLALLALPSWAAPLPTASLPQDGIVIQPHRAIYNMSLGSAKNGSNVSGVTGTMLFEWADSCDGWAVQQHMQLNFSYSEGNEAKINSTSLSWEAKDGSRYNFNVRRTTDGQETEVYRGKASLQDKAGRGFYSVPKDKEIKLEAGTVFPSFHTRMILENAAAGDKFFNRTVFDGSDEEGMAEISAFIGKRIEPNNDTEMNPELKKNPLLSAPGWPVRLAFFRPGSTNSTPDYEMDLTLLTNGVAKAMHIDYGDFTITGVLAKLEALPPITCAAPTTKN
jgi:hypothetical protein